MPNPTKPYSPFFEQAGNEIRYQRQQRRQTQKVLANCVGMNHHTLSNIERGLYTIHVERWVEIARCLRMHPADLLPREYQ